MPRPSLAVVLLIQILPQVTPGDRFAWVMQGPGIALVQSYRYEVEVDGHRLTEPLQDVTCAIGLPPVPFECHAPIPVSLGPHTLRVRSVDTSVFGSPAIEGAWSPAFTYVMGPARTVPPAPGQLRPVKPKP